MKGKNVWIAIALMCVSGSAMHFVCDLFPSPEAGRVLGVLFPVGENCWEHMKLLWYPFLAAGIAVCARRRDIRCLGGFVVGGFLSMVIQLGLFVFYRSLADSSILVLDILFYLADVVGCGLLAFHLAEKEWCRRLWRLWIVAAVIITGGVIWFSYRPGRGFVFLDDGQLP